MNIDIILAIISLCGTALGTFGGIYASARLTSYRIEQLEKKVDAQAEPIAKIAVIEEKVLSVARRVRELERF